MQKSPKKAAVKIQEEMMGKFIATTDSEYSGLIKGIMSPAKVTIRARVPHFKLAQRTKRSLSVLFQKSISDLLKYCLKT